MKLSLKVFTNKSNNQGIVYLPKKELTKLPKNIEIEIPDDVAKRSLNKYPKYFKNNPRWK